MRGHAVTVAFSSRLLMRAIVAGIVLLIVAHLLSQYGLRAMALSDPVREGLSRFNLEAEVSVATWFSHTILLIAAVLLGTIAYRRHGESDYKHWFGLAIIFLLLSIDEEASFHEISATPVRHALDIKNSFLVLSWIIPAAILVAIFALVYLRFWWRLPPDVRLRVGLGGLIFVGGAIGMEACSSAFVAHFGYETFGLVIVRVLEEGMEMTGVAVFIAGLLRYDYALRSS